ncbi:hypothetical protein AAMO2058_001696000 [Amorphochlora amoebiformis]
MIPSISRLSQQVSKKVLTRLQATKLSEKIAKNVNKASSKSPPRSLGGGLVWGGLVAGGGVWFGGGACLAGSMFDVAESPKNGDDGDDDNKDEFGNKMPKNNPGKFEMMGKEAKEVLNIDVSDGLRVALQSPLGVPHPEKQFFMSNTFWMGTQFFGPEKGFYEFQAILQQGKFVMIGGITLITIIIINN